MSRSNWCAGLLLGFIMSLVPARGAEPDLAAAARQVVEQTNRFRGQNGQGELKVNAELTKAAQGFAEYMARTDKYSHTADGKEPWERAAEAGYTYCIVLENIAYEFRTNAFSTQDLAAGCMKGWKESPPHRKNILDPDIYDIGVGVAHSSRTGRYYAVQNFGRPRSKEIKFTIVNPTDATLSYTLDGKEITLKPRYTMVHEACRPPELTLPKSKGKTFHPENGGRYAIRANASGEYSLEKQ